MAAVAAEFMPDRPLQAPWDGIGNEACSPTPRIYTGDN